MATPPANPDPLASALVSAGSLHLACEACERWLPGIQSVALLERDGEVLVLPLAGSSAGGLLLKIRNARGDRVIQAQAFFRAHGYAEEAQSRRVAMRWDANAAALVLSGLARVAG